MVDCECLPQCPFFNDQMTNMPTIADTLKIRYCREGYITCARYLVFKALGKSYIPGDLFPPNITRAQEIIAAAKK